MQGGLGSGFDNADDGDGNSLLDVFEGNALIYVHKEMELVDVGRRYPAEHYAVVDDKLRILRAIKDHWRERVTTVFVRQGHYAHDPTALAQYPAPDVSIERIGELLEHELTSLLASA